MSTTIMSEQAFIESFNSNNRCEHVCRDFFRQVDTTKWFL
jgi:hypothetical protein